MTQKIKNFSFKRIRVHQTDLSSEKLIDVTALDWGI